MKLYESIRKNLNESSYGNEYIVYVMEQTGTGSYQSKEVDRVYSEEQAEDRCAELRAETGCNTWYETVSSGSDDWGWDRDEEYDDGDTNWAAEEAADADERFENRYMGGGNGATFNEAEEVSFDEIETRMSNATTYDELYAAVSLIEDPKIRANAEEMLDICQRDGDSVEEAYSITTTEYVDPYRNDENTVVKESEDWEKALDSGKVINVYDRSKHFAPAKFFKYGDKVYYNDDHISCGNWFEHPQKGPKEIVEHIKGLLKNEDPDYNDVDYTVDILEEQPDILYNNDKEQTSIKLNDNVTTEIHNKEPDTVRANNGIKEWYIKEYPKDTLGKEIPESLTFNDISNALDNHKDVYELLSPADDSIVRERVFAELADIMGVNYDYIYNKWLGESDSIHKYKVVVKHDKGKATLTTTASNKEAAIKNICNTEKCPESAVVKVTELKEMDNSNGLTNIDFEEYCKDKLADLGTADVKDLDGNTVQVKVAFEQPIRDYGNCKVLDSEDAMDKLGTDGETIEFVDEKGEYHNSPMVSPVTILSRLEFNKIDNDFYKSMIQHWNEIKDLFESEENHYSFYCNWCGSTFPGKLKDDGTMPNCPTCYENRYKDDPDKDKDGHANKGVHADIAGETADKIHEEFRNAKDRQRETLEKICEKYNTGVQDYLYVDGYGDFDDLIEDLQACDKLNESYAVVEYWGNDWKSKEKVINGKTTKEVEKKVLKLADKNEVIATRQASADLQTSEVLCDMGDGVQRWDYNNNKFEEMDESEKKKYWTYY